MKPLTLLSSGTVREVKAGTVLGKVTASDKHTEWDVSASDGSQNADLILAETVNVPASGDEKSVAYRHGEFLEIGLTFDPDANAAQILAAKDVLEAKGVYIK
nr:head decoration protein [Pseudodesulfovibrio sp. JC047]